MFVLPVVVPTLFADLQLIVFSVHANVKLHNMYFFLVGFRFSCTVSCTRVHSSFFGETLRAQLLSMTLTHYGEGNYSNLGCDPLPAIWSSVN